MMPKFIMMVGLPASGKSTYAEELAKRYDANIHSSDSIREELSGDINNQNINDLVFKTLHSRIKEDLTNGKSCIYDATNINYKRRMAFLNELNKITCEKHCYFIATPYTQCLHNNAQRERKVPLDVIERMYRHFDPPYYYEGWDYIEVVYAYEGYKKYYGIPHSFLDYHKFDDQHNSHHQLTLGDHCKKAWHYVIAHQEGDELYNVELRCATMLHDCGKPFCKTFMNNKGEYNTEEAHYYDHQYTGSYDSFFWGTSENNPLYIATLIRWHMQPYFLTTEKSIEKYRKLWGEELYRSIMLLHEADEYAH